MFLKAQLEKELKDILGKDLKFTVFYPPEGFGDYSTNAVFLLSKRENKSFEEAGAGLIEKLKERFKDEFEKIELTPKGFLNFYLSKEYLQSQVKEILNKKEKYGSGDGGKKINLEFVSANPAGPLTIGNGRSAVYGDTLANILEKAGNKIIKEYYINDAGNQVEILGESVAKRYLEIMGESVEYEENLYQGDYIIDIARKFKKEEKMHASLDKFEILRKETKNFAIKENLKDIKDSLTKLGVKFDVWFSEKSLHDSGKIKEILNYLEFGKISYKKEGAIWFKATDFDLDQDVVVVKSTGEPTYLLSDFAYAKDKINRGFDLNIYVLGADHHGDIARIKSGIKALNFDEDKFVFPIHQLVSLKEKGRTLRMSKRKGVFVTLKELLEKIPTDIIRYFFLEKSLDTHIEFDMDLAKEESTKNPVYYIQYAFARINSIFKKSGASRHSDVGSLKLLNKKEELDLLKYLIKFPELINDISKNYQIHQLATYAQSTANKFHGFYEKHPVLVSGTLENARLSLAAAAQIILRESLRLMGISSPEKM